MPISRDRVIAIILLFGLAFVLVCMSWPNAFGADDMGYGNTRVFMQYAVRELMAEPQTTWIEDTTLARIMNFAHYTTVLALGEHTDVDSAVVIAVQGDNTYAIPTGAMGGQIVGVSRKIETNQGGGDVGFIEISMEQMGKLGEGVIPNSYAVRGDHIFLGTAPTGGDTLLVYYVPLPGVLSATDSTFNLSVEDQSALLYLTAGLVSLRDAQIQKAQLYINLWQSHIAAKRGRQPQVVPGQ